MNLKLLFSASILFCLFGKSAFGFSQHSEVRLSIALPHEGSISQSGTVRAPNLQFKTTFPVVIQNTSKRQLEFFASGTSFGDETMSFEIVGDNGSEALLHQINGGRVGNGPNKVRIDPGEVFVYETDVFFLKNNLDRIEKLKDQTHFRMRAILTQGVDPQDKMHALWKGSVTSAWIEINWIR